MRKLIIFTSCFLAFMVLVFPAFLSLGIRFVPNQKQSSLSRTRDIYGKIEIIQEFTSQEDRLVGMAMSIKNPNLKNKKDAVLELYEGQELIRTSILNGGVIEDGGYVRFMLDEVTESKGRDYWYRLSSHSAGSEDLLSVFTTEEELVWMGEMVHDEELVEEGVAFVTLHKPESKVGLIGQIYGDWFGRLWADRSFAISYGVVLVVLLVLLVI